MTTADSRIDRRARAEGTRPWCGPFHILLRVSPQTCAREGEPRAAALDDVVTAGRA